MSGCFDPTRCGGCKYCNREAKRAQSEKGKSNIETLLDLTNRLKALLENPSPGIFTWHEAVAKLARQIGEYG